jgi:2'-5' RNA ligase
MTQLQAAIEQGCRAAGFESERRAFSPHLTLGRVSQQASREDISRISRALAENRVGPLGKCSIQQVTLYKSDLNPAGAVYSPLGHFLLKPN